MRTGWIKGLVAGVVIGVCTLPMVGWAQGQPPGGAAPAGAQGKPRGCLTAKEQTAEREVRHGVRLREMTFRCDREYPQKEPLFPKWEEFAKQSTVQITQQVDLRKKAFAREFPQSPAATTQELDDRLVVFFRHYPLTAPYCEGVGTLMTAVTNGGWKIFSKQAATARTEIMLWDYKLCR